MKKSTIKVLGIATIVMLLVTGCGKVPKLKDGKDAVVTLKGDDISIDDLYGQMKERYALSVLLDMIDEEILNKKYKDTSEIKRDVKDQIDLYLQQFNNDEAKLLEQTYQAWGVDTMDELTDYLTLQKKKQKAIEDYAKKEVTDDEINKYYEEKIFGDLKVKHILLSANTSENATDAEKQEAEKKALEKANEVISKLKNGEEFDALAKEYSDDESNKDKGGLLPDFVHGDMVAEFEEAALNLKDGEYTTTPVKTQYGYHVILRVSQKKKPSLKTVKDDIIEKLGEEKLTNEPVLSVTALEALRKEYKVNIQDDQLKNQYERYLKNLKAQY